MYSVSHKALARFWDKVKKTETCWLWNATVGTNGYPQFYLNGRHRAAHRISWEMSNGSIPEGMCVCHTCDITHCVRPDHLFLGSNQENILDRVRKGRSYRPGSDLISGRKLTDSQALELIQKRKAGATLSSLANEYGLNCPAVSAIINGKSWKHLPRGNAN